MTKQITLEELLKLVTVKQERNGSWHIVNVKGNVYGNIEGSVDGYVDGSVEGDVKGDVFGDVSGNVYGNVSFNIYGDVCGNVEGHVKGTVFGNVESDVKGDVQGDVCGNVFGDVASSVCGNVDGDVEGTVFGTVWGNVYGNVQGNVQGNVYGTIKGKEWQLVETPNDKFKRLLKETGNQELIEAFNGLAQMERSLIKERTLASIDYRRATGGDLGGRPRSYSEEQAGQLQKLLAEGMSLAAAARTCGLSESTARRIRKEAT